MKPARATKDLAPKEKRGMAWLRWPILRPVLWKAEAKPEAIVGHLRVPGQPDL